MDLSDGVDPADIRDVFGGAPSDDSVVSFYIDAADQMLADRTDASDFSGEERERVQVFVTAHLIAAESPTSEVERVGPVREDYEGVSPPDAGDADLSETRWGRRAISLDPSGKLASADDPVEFHAYGP